jgi:hypothetical protein
MYIPTDPMILQNKIKQAIRFTLQCLISIYIALEIAIPPDPYARYLIVVLVLYICLKYSIVEKIIERYNKVLSWLKIKYHVG